MRVLWIACLAGLLAGGTLDALKLLHLSLHRGCINDFAYVANKLGIELTSIFIQDQPERWLDDQATGNQIYNIGYERAARIWQKHHQFFDSFDAVITSDTAPLSRIFLQNGWKKPLIIWICNRFDYCDYGSLDCSFPDETYYSLFRQARKKKNVIIAGYTPFEHHYARSKHVDTGTLIIKPCGAYKALYNGISAISQTVDKSRTFFLPPYTNDTAFADTIRDLCKRCGLAVYQGRYNGPADLAGFRAIIHFPYAWSNLAFFENIRQGLQYLVPSKQFFFKLVRQHSYWFTNSPTPENLGLSEWYAPEHADIITYFDSWDDLIKKMKTIDTSGSRKRYIEQAAQRHHDSVLQQWTKVFEQVINYMHERSCV